MLWVTPHMLRNAARLLLLLLLAADLAPLMLAFETAPSTAALTGYATTVAALVAGPSIRRGDVLSAVAIGLGGVELADGVAHGHLDFGHAGAALGGVIAAALPLYARDVRALSAGNGYMSFGERRRRDRRRRSGATTWVPLTAVPATHDRSAPHAHMLEAVIETRG